MGIQEILVLWWSIDLSNEFVQSFFDAHLETWLNEEHVTSTSEALDLFCTYCGASV
jgi:hypothetical protein